MKNSNLLSATEFKNCSKNVLQNENVSVFQSSEFGSVRTIQSNDKILFCASDVAKCLGYSKPNNAINQHCKGYTLKQGIGVVTGKKADGTDSIQTIEMSFITEGDVYRLIAHSKLESAQKFESWVFDEVLPSIRKNGGYVVNQDKLSPEELISNALVVANKILADREARIKLQDETIQRQDRLIENQNVYIEQAKPKVQFVDNFENSDSCEEIETIGLILAGRVSNKIYGSKKIFPVLVEQGIIRKKFTSEKVPYYVACAGFEQYFKTTTTPFMHGDKLMHRPKLWVNPKGHIYLLTRFSQMTKEEAKASYQQSNELDFGGEK